MFRVREDVLSETLDGQTVLLHLTTGLYFRLNPTGARIWSCLEQGLPLSSYYEELASRHGGDAEQYRQDGDALLANLLERDLICRA